MDRLGKLQLLLFRIPKGKVTTYSALAKKMKLHPRTVGMLLRSNPLPGKYPCYRVVHCDGRVGGYSCGVSKKISKLKSDGVDVRKGKVNLKVHLFKF